MCFCGGGQSGLRFKSDYVITVNDVYLFIVRFTYLHLQHTSAKPKQSYRAGIGQVRWSYSTGYVDNMGNTSMVQQARWSRNRGLLYLQDYWPNVSNIQVSKSLMCTAVTVTRQSDVTQPTHHCVIHITRSIRRTRCQNRDGYCHTRITQY